jgi:hypothetical protein
METLEVAKMAGDVAFRTYLANLLAALSEFGNSLAGGDPHQTISYRAAVAAKAGDEAGILICKILDEVDPGHCARALAAGH